MTAAGQMLSITLFQSSPDPKAGRHETLMAEDVLTCPVSILARPEGRAPRRRWVASPTPRHSFNPRPTRRPGATMRLDSSSRRCRWFQSSPDPKAGRHLQARVHGGQLGEVSILARPEGRAPRLLSRGPRLGPDVSILARPEGRAPPAQSEVLTRRAEFQSSPDPKAGRHGVTVVFGRSVAWFQSSPDPKAGRARGEF